MRIILAFLIVSVLYTGAALAQNVYIANQGSNTVSVISGDPTVTIDVGMGPSALAVTPDGDFVYVANSGSDTVSVIQTLALIHISEPTRQAEISYAVFCLI